MQQTSCSLASFRRLWVWLCTGVCGLMWPSWLAAQQVAISILDSEGRLIEELVVVGSRSAPRTALGSIVPVDSFGSVALSSQSDPDLSNIIRSLVPSFHVNTNPSRDSAALLRPVNLRGLAPDHTLVLVNNKRRHRGAVIQWISNGASDGAQGPDISAIPSVAIKRMEVLRDGAAAQYGSDAIAGVINFVLKDAAQGGSLEAKWGFRSEDSSEDQLAVSGNIGLPAFGRGFLNLSGEYSESSSTDRSVQHPSAAAVAAAGIPGVADPAKPWGEPDVRDGFKLFANFGLPLNDMTELYAFGNYTSRESETAFFYRPPQGRTGVYVSGGKLLIGGGASCKERYDYDATAANVAIASALLRDDPDCFGFAEILPQGFTPLFGADMSDMSSVAGVRGTLSGGLNYDVSASWGRNKMDFFIDETVNASHGPNTPRSFDIGDYIQTETNFHIDLSYPLELGLTNPLNVAGGFEWREEEFEVTTGEPASWDTGPYGADGFSARSNGFGGFNPASSGKWDRANVAAYLDLETDLNERWRVNAALRWEDFDGFGSVTNFKLASRVRISEILSVRAAYSTGFRAPTPGQQNANNLATVVDSATGEFREQGTVASTNPVAIALGGAVLDAEESKNYTAGLVLELPNGASLTIDWFRIDLEDRIALSPTMSLSSEVRQALIDSGVTEAADFNNVRFFANDFDTRTQGVDAVVTYGLESNYGRTDVLLGYNYTDTDLKAFSAASTGARRRALERGSPSSRLSLSVAQAYDRLSFMMRYNYFGSWFDSDDNHVHDGYGLLDVSAQYAFTDNLSFTLGSDNVLDSYPDKAVRSPSSGRLYPRYSPAGYSGRVVYGRLRYAF